MIVVCATESPRSAIISARSRKLSLYRRHQRTQSTMISWSNCRPLKSPSIFVGALSFDRFANDYAVSKQFAPEPLHQPGWNTIQRG